MRLFYGILFFLVSLATAGHAQQGSPLRAMLTGDESRGWEAVGRLNIAGRSMCTGALIASDLVLTAAHCLYDKSSKQQVDPTKIDFLAGWRAGRATAYAKVKRAVVHPDYTFATDSENIKVRNDIAVLQLMRPIHKTSITPFEIGPRPRKGADIGIVSYAFDRADSPSIQESCRVMARQSGTLVLSCDVDFGSSGAPIFDMSNGIPRIVSVVSAKAIANGHKISLGTSLEEPLQEIMAKLKSTEGQFKRVLPTSNRLIHSEGLDHTGAKFVRP
ncbi:MAG TPA: trypsin-like serine protease [Rhodobacteraceae bacterium]|nr:trypsin-like serine protease [Paracoccaceae bacterium]